MAEPEDGREMLSEALYWLNAQAESHNEVLRSEPVLQYASVIKKSIELMRNILAHGNFETLLNVEMAIQKLEVESYSHDENMVASIQKTREDLAAGILDYRQLVASPESYRIRGYRKRDRTGPHKEFPLDTMRKALRSQAARVGNFAKNPMLGPEEKEFHLLRVSLLKQAEKLYENLQARGMGMGG